MSIKRILASLGIVLLLSTTALAAPSFSVSRSVTNFSETITPENIEAAKKQQVEKKFTLENGKFTLKKIQNADLVTFVKAFPDAENVEIYSEAITDLSPLATLKKVSRIQAKTPRVKDVTPLSGLTTLTRIDLQYDATGQNLTWMSKLTALNSITLAPEGLTSVEGLPSRPNIYTITLDYINVPNLDALAAALPGLRNINLKYGKFADISALNKLQKIEDISFYGSTLKDFSPLAKLPHINRFMYYAVKGADFSTLGTLKQTKIFWGGLTKLDSIAWLKDMPKLEKIDFFAEYVSDYTPLKNAPNLKSLQLWNMKVPVGDLAFVKDLKNLTYLKIDNNTGVTGFEAIGTLSKLENLYILRNNGKDNTRIDFGFLQKLPALKRLELSKSTAENFAVNGLKNVNVIDLTYMNIGENTKPLDLSLIKDLPNLKSLDLEDSKLENFQKMDNLPELRTITVRKSTGITDFSVLSKFPNVKVLTVSKDAFTEAQLATIPKGIKVNMR